MTDKAIVLISGWSGTEVVLGPLEKQFVRAGFDVIRTNIHGGYGRIQESAQSVASIVNAFYPSYEHVTIIGHSMGGLVARYGLTKRLFKADAFVSIATPHNGSLLSSLAPWSKSAMQMTPNSSFLRHLGHPEIASLALQAGLEEVIWPHASAEISWGENITIPGVDHVMIARSARTFYEIWSWLNDNFFPHDFFVASGYGHELLIPYGAVNDTNCG